MCAGTRAKVVTPDCHREEFDILAEVVQGHTLAPFLFVIVLDYMFRKAIRGSEQDPGLILTTSSADRPELCG